ncbi:glycosyltransferase family 25 protein [Ferruginibacter lapsinanis]|uniref:glycosyltransferase family 25 protein n=1 Tax=Ferruginibacter lapsinanis TaxID=563172 RepID=UPI001E5C98E7|nr:glycosyltransferase family 25 protein [Ferruginibacter lapsinanis]UEG50919.1 glycosyltransferase family 25 protein [Ferruginibacter lapsinanis]
MTIDTNISQHLQQYFDKIFVVSVPRFTERHLYVQEQLKGLPFDFFWGADKLKLDIEELMSAGIYDEVKGKKLQRQKRALSLGEIACSLSHRMVYEEMIKHNWQRVLIFEDDVCPIHSNIPLLTEVFAELPQNWELVYLGYQKYETVTPVLKRKQLFYKILSSMGLMKWTYTMVCNMLPKPYSKHLNIAGFHECTHAYCITLSAAKKLLDAQTPIVYRADDLLSYTILKGDLNAFITQPKFFDQGSLHQTGIVSEVTDRFTEKS